MKVLSIIYSIIAAFIAQVLLYGMGNDIQAALKVDTRKECTTCHISWLEEFKRDHQQTLVSMEEITLSTTGKQDASSTERMCFSCHDGFVLDSRFLWQEKAHAHPVGIQPPADMELPKIDDKIIFPLNNEGKLYCGTCHTAHGVEWRNNSTDIFMRVENLDSDLCTACHDDKEAEIVPGLHPMIKTTEHNIKNVKNSGGQFSSDGKIICESCHKAHGSPQQNMLLVDNQKSKLCAGCHKNQIDILGSQHDLDDLDLVQLDGPCSACHQVHNAKGLIASTSADNTTEQDPLSSKCNNCHNKDGIAAKTLIGNHNHPIGVDMKDMSLSITKNGWKHVGSSETSNEPLTPLPLFNQKGLIQESSEGHIGCNTCHDPHQGKQGNNSLNLTVNKTEQTSNKDSSSFLRIPQGNESQLCTNCHLDKRSVLTSSHNLAENENGKSSCEQCHVSHKASNALLSNVPHQTKSTNLSNQWCINCHKADGLAKDKVLFKHNHPLDVEMTVKESGQLPLVDTYGSHVQDKGMVACVSCHDPHKGNIDAGQQTPENLANADNNYLRFPTNGEENLCLQCHSEMKVVIGTDHDLTITAPDTLNILGKSSSQSGACGQCHLTHGTERSQGLWAQLTTEGRDINEKQCLSCHSELGNASNKIPMNMHHPDDIYVWSASGRKHLENTGALPIKVYDKEGHSAAVGAITCLSCHDPHQWSPDGSWNGSGTNLEGDVTTSFLRIKDTRYIVCADCHGNDSLFRYKYFHGDSAHQQKLNESD